MSDGRLLELQERYQAAMHAMQSGVAVEMALPRSTATEPKHLRVGINSAMCEHAALVKLLVTKGIITDEEYAEAIVEAFETEVRRYEKRLSEATSARVSLA